MWHNPMKSVNNQKILENKYIVNAKTKAIAHRSHAYAALDANDAAVLRLS